LFLLIIPVSSFSQSKVIGCYEDYFGYQVQLNADMTFKFTWRFDLSSSWTKGKWTMNKDTVYFHATPIYDTVVSILNDGFVIDTLFLSEDETSERMTQEQLFRSGYGLSSGGQDNNRFPEKLFYKKERLYNIKGKRLVKKNQKGWSQKKYPPWFSRC
jgi:hypothetical protein